VGASIAPVPEPVTVALAPLMAAVMYAARRTQKDR
jgi:hypothetical protein